MAIAFEELEGSPTIDVTSSGVTARRLFRVAWDDWREFAESLTGGWRRVGDEFKLQAPLPFPNLPGVVVESIHVAPFDPKNPSGAATVSLDRGHNEYPAGAKLTVTYKNASTDAADGDAGKRPDIEPGTILTFRSDLSAESVLIPGRSWKWNVAGNPKVPDDVNPGVLMPTGSYVLEWDRVARPPWSAIRSLRGKVNDAPFYDADAGKLLFLGARATRQFEFMRNASLWTIEYSFAERSQTWNAFFREETGQWTEISDQAGNGPYADGDFTLLFQFGG